MIIDLIPLVISTVRVIKGLKEVIGKEIPQKENHSPIWLMIVLFWIMKTLISTIRISIMSFKY